MALLAALLGMVLIVWAYRAGIEHGRSQAIAACIVACERQTARRIDDLLARLAARLTDETNESDR